MRAGDGHLATADGRETVRRGPPATLEELADAAHELHLDRSVEWRPVLSEVVSLHKARELHRQRAAVVATPTRVLRLWPQTFGRASATALVRR